MKSSVGKGDTRRPMCVTEVEFARNWEKTFGQTKNEVNNTETEETGSI